MNTLKSLVQRGTLLGAAGALVISAVVPTVAVFAAALNPLTERSLLLSSSAPGWQDTDGSSYSTGAPNPAEGVNGTPGTYAPAGSGPNGKKTGETFAFKTSSDGVIKGLTFQYCTTAAGLCRGPGNNAGDADPNKDGSPADSTRELNETPTEGWDKQTSDLNFEGTFIEGAGAGQFQVFIGGVAQTGWSFTAATKEDAAHTDPKSGKNNYVTLSNGTAATPTVGGTQVRVVFRPSESVFITNPGANEFFVKLNTYDSETSGDHVPGNAHNIDGGVTVANVMTDSIHITTKVLETMSFSVGTRNRDTLTINCGDLFGTGSQPEECEGDEGATGGPTQVATHGTCAPLQQINNNRLNLGDPNAENSLQTGKAWAVYSYWRLSSNSSGGATVYYSGNTLANTVGDEIESMETAAQSQPGKEQFGLGFVAPETASAEYNTQMSNKPISSYPFITLSTQPAATTPQDFTALAAQPISTDYRNAEGTIDNGSGGSGTAVFKFKKASSTVPEPIAQENETVISCATARMRYVANIAADTPAGVYTTKVNYLAAPQY